MFPVRPQQVQPRSQLHPGPRHKPSLYFQVANPAPCWSASGSLLTVHFFYTHQKAEPLWAQDKGQQSFSCNIWFHCYVMPHLWPEPNLTSWKMGEWTQRGQDNASPTGISWCSDTAIYYPQCLESLWKKECYEVRFFAFSLQLSVSKEFHWQNTSCWTW